MRRLLVTGRHGFVGAALADLVAQDPALQSWTMADVPPTLDLRDKHATAELVEAAAPDAVLHLAAQSWVPESFRDPEATFQINVLGTLHLLQALRDAGFRGPMVYVSSGDVYGRVPEDELPVSENRLPAPRNPYAVSKLAGEALCRQWAFTEEMQIVVARPFNHVGPGQSDRFVLSDFARQIAEIARGQREPVVTAGDIDVTRDFTDVRDVVKAYFALLQHGGTGEIYNVCSGRERSVRSLLMRLAALAGVAVRIEEDPSRLRRAEQRRVVGDPAKIGEATGWTASTPLDETLIAILKDWERKVDHV